MSRYLVVGDPVVVLGTEALIPDGALIIEDESVVRAGPRAVLSEQGPFDQVLGSPGHFVMPGFVNCHYHSELATGPGLYQFIYERAHVYVGSGLGPISEEDLYNGILWGLVTAIRGGQTATVDMYYGRPSLAGFGTTAALQAYQDSGLRTMFGLVCRDQNTIVHEEDEQFLRRLPAELADEVRRSQMGIAWPLDRVFGTYGSLLREWHGRQGRIQIAAAPDWTPSCSDELYLRCHRFAGEHDTGMLTHAVETRSEALFSMERYGKPAVQRLADLGVLDRHAVLGHFIWVTDDEIAMFADSGAVASNNAGSNLRLSSGICRLRDLLDAGGRMAFGTDGISFSDREDFFAELRLACYLQRIPRTFEEARLPSEDVLRAAAVNGARAVGCEGKLGSLEPGRLADLLVLKKDRICYPPGRYDQEPFLDVILDRADSTDLDAVMVHGRVLMAGGRVTVVDEDAVRASFAKSVERIYAPSSQVQRWAELGRAVEPVAIDFYRRWYETPLSPGYVYNARSLPGGQDRP
jgi:5-methylthioadenosine/S-adenosylhomocysteine deaminase